MMFGSKIIKSLSVLITVLTFVSVPALQAQSLEHPHIWVSKADKAGILNNIATYDWAESLFTQTKARVDAAVNTHKSSPIKVLNEISDIPGVSGDRTPHTEMLASASEAAILYYLTDDADYAQYAADILSHYNQRLAVQEARKYSNGTGVFFSDWWLESRALFPKIAMIYDFLYDYVNDPTNTVYDLASNSRIPFDNGVAQTTVQTLSDIVLKSISATKSNHSVLASNGALFNLMMIDNDATRERFFTRYYVDPNSERFDAYEWTLEEFTNQDIWNETFGYSKASHELVIQSLNVIDRYKPELNVLNSHLRIFDGFSFYENYYYPSGDNLRFGDTGYENDLLKGYQWILNAATRKNLPEYVKKAKQALKFEYDEMNGYDPLVYTDRLGWWNPLQLLWGVNVEDTVVSLEPILATTQHVAHAGIVIQRNYSTTDVLNYGMMYYSGGASYVHTHSTGIDLELYGHGLVMGAESGSSSYGTDEHENYRVRLAAHNTVIANGSGLRGTNWATKMNDVKLLASEPLSEEIPISTKFSFATQYINDTYNGCIQQRTTSIVRINSFSAYYFDIFRSKGKTTNNYHDYIYHNIGDDVLLRHYDPVYADLPMSPSTRYASEVKGVTGWTFFEDVESSAATDQAVRANFNLTSGSRTRRMNAYFPAGIAHEYSIAKAPYTKGATEGYDSKKTPVLTLRKQGEAWNEPFVAVYEPAGAITSYLESVKNIVVDGRVIGAIVTSKESQDYILAFDKVETIEIPEHYITFTGRFAIIRKVNQTEDTQTITMYIGEGETLTYGDITLQAGDDKKENKVFYGVPKLNNASRFTLDTRVLGSGGTISVDPLKSEYIAAEQATVTAHPEEGYVLDAWLGDATGNDDSYKLTFYADRSVNARFRFADYYYLNVSAENGTVSQSVEGNEHPERTEIELIATPIDRFEFVGWTGDIISDENPLSIRMDSTITVVANFKELELYKLNINVVGNGKVSLLPEQDEYLAGTKVTVFAQANDDDSFINWTGDYTSAFTTIYLNMDSVITITANFSGASGLNDSPLQNTKVFPNPNNGVMTLSTGVLGESQYAISDIEGRIVQSGILQGTKQISLDNSGFYFIQVTTNGHSKTLKVLVRE